MVSVLSTTTTKCQTTGEYSGTVSHIKYNYEQCWYTDSKCKENRMQNDRYAMLYLCKNCNRSWRRWMLVYSPEKWIFLKKYKLYFIETRKRQWLTVRLGDIYEHSEFSTEMRWTMEDRSREPGAGSCSKAFQVE